MLRFIIRIIDVQKMKYKQENLHVNKFYKMLPVNFYTSCYSHDVTFKALHNGLSYRDYRVTFANSVIEYIVQPDLVKENGFYYIGVHIRRTDQSLAIAHSKTETFISHIDKLIAKHNQYRIYLATDDPREKEIILQRYGRAVIYRDYCLDRNSEQGIVDALTELRNLSECDVIIGSYNSSYSEVAAYMNNKELIFAVS